MHFFFILTHRNSNRLRADQIRFWKGGQHFNMTHLSFSSHIQPVQSAGQFQFPLNLYDVEYFQSNYLEGKACRGLCKITQQCACLWLWICILIYSLSPICVKESYWLYYCWDLLSSQLSPCSSVSPSHASFTSRPSLCVYHLPKSPQGCLRCAVPVKIQCH